MSDAASPMDVVEKSVWLACPPARAFALFTEEVGAWWPQTRRHTADANSLIRMEATGRFFERAADGLEIELGVVRVFEPPHRLELDFFPGTSPTQPTAVRVTFVAQREGTLVTVVHRATAASRELWGQRVSRFVASWEVVLHAFAAHAERA